MNSFSVYGPGLAFVRTPSERFHALEGWHHDAQYLQDLPGFPGLRLAYYDIGPKEAEVTWLCLHGQRTWSYAYRLFLDRAAARNERVVALDLFGFGQSDKPTDDRAYDFVFHRNTVLALISALALDRIHLLGFDWGGWIGSTLILDPGLQIGRMVLGNMTYHLPELPTWSGFDLWLASHNAQTDPGVSRTLKRIEPGLSAEILRAYDAPFPAPDYKAGVRSFPNLIPYREETAAAGLTRATIEALKETRETDITLIAGDLDPVLGTENMMRVAGLIGARSQPVRLPVSGPLVFEHLDLFADTVLP